MPKFYVKKTKPAVKKWGGRKGKKVLPQPNDYITPSNTYEPVQNQANFQTPQMSDVGVKQFNYNKGQQAFTTPQMSDYVAPAIPRWELVYTGDKTTARRGGKGYQGVQPRTIPQYVLTLNPPYNQMYGATTGAMEYANTMYAPEATPKIKSKLPGTPPGGRYKRQTAHRTQYKPEGEHIVRGLHSRIAAPAHRTNTGVLEEPIVPPGGGGGGGGYTYPEYGTSYINPGEVSTPRYGQGMGGGAQEQSNPYFRGVPQAANRYGANPSTFQARWQQMLTTWRI